MGIGAMILLIMSAVLQPKALMGVLNLNATNWFWIILTMASLLAYLAVWYRGLKLAPATSATAVLVASTLVTNLLSAIFVTHSLNSLLVVQSVLIAAGVYAIYKVEGRAQNASKASLAQ